MMGSDGLMLAGPVSALLYKKYSDAPGWRRYTTSAWLALSNGSSTGQPRHIRSSLWHWRRA